MAIFLTADSKILIQGITGGEGRKHGARMLAAGAQVVGGTNPKKAGTTVELSGVEVPVLATVAETMAALAPFERSQEIQRHVRTGRVQMLGSSGTVTTLAGIYLALPRYIRALVDGSVLTFEQISAVSAHLAGLDLAAETCASGDSRSKDQRRADALVQLGIDALNGFRGCPSCRNVVVPNDNDVSATTAMPVRRTPMSLWSRRRSKIA